MNYRGITIVLALILSCLAGFEAAGGAGEPSRTNGGPVSTPQTNGQAGPKQDRLLREAPSVADRGEAEMKNFAHANISSITPKLIEDIAEQGRKERKENLIILARIMAEEKNDTKSIAETLVSYGDYFIQISRRSKAMGMFGKALRMFEQLGDEASQGKVYEIMGNAVLSDKDKSEAAGYFDKAIPLLEKADDWKELGHVYARKGFIRSDAGDISGAKELYEKALSMSEKAGDKESKRYIFFLLGDIHLTNGDLVKTQEMFEKALPLYDQSEHKTEVGKICLVLGKIHMSRGNNSKARELFDRALTNYGVADFPLELGIIHKSLGDLQFMVGNFAGAEKEYLKALPYLARADNLKNQGEVCNSIGFIQLMVANNHSTAREWYEKALSFAVRANDPKGQGAAYTGLGEIYGDSGNLLKALELYEKALPFIIKAGDKNDEASLYISMAKIYKIFGNNTRVVELFEKILPIYAKTLNTMKNGGFYRIMAEVNLQTGNIAKALELYDQALACYRDAKDIKNEGEIYQAKAQIYLRKDDVAHARELYEKALSCFSEAGYQIGQGNIYHYLGKIQVKSGSNTKALEFFEKALQLLEGKDNEAGLVTYALMDIYTEMVKIHKSSGNYARALNLLDKALVCNARMGSISLINGCLLMMKGHVQYDASKKEEAAELYETAIAQFEKMRRESGLDEFKKYLMMEMYDGYQAVTLIMISNGYKEKAFRYAEAMKARLFLDQLAEGRVDLGKGIAPELKKQRDNLEQELTRINTRLQDELKKKEPDEGKAEGIRWEYRNKEAELEELKNTIRLKNPIYAQVEYPQPVSVTDLQHKTLGDNEVLLEYFIAESSIYRFMVSHDGYDVIKLPITKDELEKGIASLKGYVSDPGKASQAVLPLATDKIARRLYDALIAPGIDGFRGKTLIIVPDGVMATLPLEMLKSGDRYAIEKHSLVYVQSASVLEMLRNHPMKSSVTGFIGFGDPVYDYESFKTGKPEKGVAERQTVSYADIVRGGYLENGGALNRLQGSGDEVKSIAALFTGKGEQAVSNLRLDAREEKARSTDMEGYSYIHFATHGILNDRLQAIALSQIPDSGNDGFLTVGKLMNSRFNARLVVLSACRTGEGKLVRGEGVTGLTRAVMYAGTPAAVVSLWSVSDDGTKELMIKMYHSLIHEGKTPGEALREAKLAMIRERTYAAPYYWGAFVMYGE